jgi:hypothetical protein
MSETDSVEIASRRLGLALDALDAAVERRRQADRDDAGLAGQVEALGVDRARLAAELDHEAARARALESANREVVHRLDSAIETIRTVLATQQGEPEG